MTNCPCGSGGEYDHCCGPLIAGGIAPTAEALMRSRYTAFVHGKLDYLHKTSAGEALLKFDRGELARSQSSTEWLGLTITAVEAGGPDDVEGHVTFKVSFRQDGRHFVQTERSQFRKIDGQWRYLHGEVDFKSRPLAAVAVGRNDPCPCGSGKKYKKCCGA